MYRSFWKDIKEIDKVDNKRIGNEEGSFMFCCIFFKFFEFCIIYMI